MRLVLASASPRRAELLRAAGFSFEVQPVDVDERVQPGERPPDYVRRLAVEKATAGHRPDERGRVTLGADTAVVVDGAIFGKPTGPADAAAMVRRLSGRVHEVVTGICLCSGIHQVSHVESTTVEFRPLRTQDIEWYVQTGEGTDKAGGYAIQGLASRFVRRIVGSYPNVVGLPVAAVCELLADLAGELDGAARGPVLVDDWK